MEGYLNKNPNRVRITYYQTTMYLERREPNGSRFFCQLLATVLIDLNVSLHLGLIKISIMFKKTITFSFACLILSVFTLTSGCSGSASSGSDSDTTFLESGVKYIYLERGDKDAPKVDSLTHVTTHINLIIEEDTVWSTYSPGQREFEFDAQKTSLIKGFDELVMHARKGDRILAVIPPELGYGPEGNGPSIPGNSTLVFDIDFLNVENPKISLSDVLYAVYQKDGVESMLEHYQNLTLDSATYKMDMREWYTLSDKMLREGAFDKAITMWDFRLKEIPDLGGHYMKAQACQNLGQIDVAITTLEKGIEVAQDTAGLQFVNRYLEQLKALPK